MIPALFAQVHNGGGFEWSFGNVIIAIIVLAACVGILLIALRVFGIPMPQWVWQILAIVVVAFVAILAIRFLLSM